MRKHSLTILLVLAFSLAMVGGMFDGCKTTPTDSALKETTDTIKVVAKDSMKKINKDTVKTIKK